MAKAIHKDVQVIIDELEGRGIEVTPLLRSALMEISRKLNVRSDFAEALERNLLRWSQADFDLYSHPDDGIGITKEEYEKRFRKNLDTHRRARNKGERRGVEVDWVGGNQGPKNEKIKECWICRLFR